MRRNRLDSNMNSEPAVYRRCSPTVHCYMDNYNVVGGGGRELRRSRCRGSRDTSGSRSFHGMGNGCVILVCMVFVYTDVNFQDMFPFNFSLLRFSAHTCNFFDLSLYATPVRFYILLNFLTINLLARYELWCISQ